MEEQQILIIDDDPNLRRSLSDILRAKGYESISAQNGTEGISLMKQYATGLVIIDLGLPDMSGVEVLQRVKEECPSAEAIILTGNASLDSAIEATNRGAFSYLIKPYSVDLLLLHIKRALEKQKARETILQHTLELEKMNTELARANRELTNEVAERKRAEAETAKLVIELRDALSKVRTLAGLLPICANCKKVRNDKGYWEQIEIFVRDHSDAEFTHSICPECMKKLYPEYCREE